MSESEGKRGLVSFLRRLGVQRPALSSQVSAAEVLRRLAQIEEDAAAYYSALAQHSDLPWVRQFALRLAEEEKVLSLRMAGFVCSGYFDPAYPAVRSESVSV